MGNTHKRGKAARNIGMNKTKFITFKNIIYTIKVRQIRRIYDRGKEDETSKKQNYKRHRKKI